MRVERSERRADGGPEAAGVGLTVAVPVYNEAGILDRLHGLLTQACSRAGEPYELLFVDDGSTDDTAQVLRRLAASDPHVSVVELSRNFGHPAALAAAVELASGRLLVVLDADLQDDPLAIPEMLRLHREEGAEVVYAVRTKRKEGFLLRACFNLFHWMLARTSTYDVPRDAGSFGLLGPRALAEVRALTERLRYFPGLRAFVGFKQVGLPVERGERYDGASRVRLTGLLRLAGMAFFTQTRAAVTLFYALSALSLVASVGVSVYALVSKFIGIAAPAWTSLVTMVSFFSSVIILGQAFICEYLVRVYAEVRQRPVYIVARLARAPVARRDEQEAAFHGPSD
jgi:dolichol-phosphate mannosyltransferase